MSRRTLLSSEQRTRLFGIPSDAAEMATHYVLEPEDLALVRAKRRPSNRLGFAVQLCVLRRPGRPLDPSEAPPAPVLAFVANQLAIDPKLFAEYAHRAETRRELEWAPWGGQESGGGFDRRSGVTILELLRAEIAQC